VAPADGLPDGAEVVVVGGGTGGAAIAARLVEAGREVLVLEAGTDPGPFGDPRWPADLVDAERLGTSCDWGFDSGSTYPDQVVRFERARVLGGCSVHNGCAQTLGHRFDYDAWSDAGNPGWSTDELVPFFERSSEQLRVRTYEQAELTPWQAAWYEAGPEIGLPHLADLNGLDETVGIGPESVNIVDGVRWNTAFAYLDPLRERPNLTIAGDVLVDRLRLDGTRVTGLDVVRGGRRSAVTAGLVVLAGGTYGTPAVLLRTGVGPADELRALGIEVALELPGVGANLHDQPMVAVRWEGSPELEAAMAAAAASGWAPDEQVLAKACSSHEREAFDLHLLPYSPTDPGEGRRWIAAAGALLPRSRGRVSLVSRDPNVLPHVDHAFLSDPDGHDVAVLGEALALLRELAATPRLRALLGREHVPGPTVKSAAEVEAYLRAHIDNYWHPVGTTRLGPASDPAAVVDAAGRVHGIDGCLVADCSLMPVIPRATTALPAVVVAERVASLLLER
jgi:choline dehydrogenase